MLGVWWRQEIDCSHPERLENSPGPRRLGGSQLGCMWEREESCPCSPSLSLSSLHLPLSLCPDRHLGSPGKNVGLGDLIFGHGSANSMLCDSGQLLDLFGSQFPCSEDTQGYWRNFSPVTETGGST